MLRKPPIARLLTALLTLLCTANTRPSVWVQALSAPQTTPAASAGAIDASLVATYCVRCHNQKLRTADLALDTIDWSDVGRDAERLERVAQKLQMGAMPPPGLRRPDRSTSERFVS